MVDLVVGFYDQSFRLGLTCSTTTRIGSINILTSDEPITWEILSQVFFYAFHP
jgi:hypothetical protein